MKTLRDKNQLLITSKLIYDSFLISSFPIAVRAKLTLCFYLRRDTPPYIALSCTVDDANFNRAKQLTKSEVNSTENTTRTAIFDSF